MESRTIYVISESYNVDTFSVLGDTVVLAVQNLIKRRVSHVLQSVDNHVEGSPLIMNRQTLDVFTEDYFGSVEIADSYYVEEQCSTRHSFVIIIESLFPSGDGECLAGKSSKTDIKVGNILLIDLGDVAVDLSRGIEVGFVGLLRVGVPFAGEDRLDLVAEGFIESHADSAYTCEEVYGSVFRRHLPLTTFSILSAQPERFFWISFPQNLRTIQPCSSSSWFTSKSLWMFLSILGIQNSLRVFMSFLRFSQSNPCQNSLSQNTATFFPMNAISGLPGMVLTFLR